jgi:dephospho-CoA kinase
MYTGGQTSVHIFGLTGGIASGKSTVAARLRARGVPVIDADRLAREVVVPGSDGLDEIVRTFGQGVLGADGTLNRQALGRVVFGDERSRQKLNAITHPRIATLMTLRAAELARQGEPLACYEAALIVDNGLADAFRPLIVSSCPEGTQLRRLLAREGTSPEDALARIRAQVSLADRVAAADHVIDTSGSIAESAARTDETLRSICERLGVDPQRYA